MNLKTFRQKSETNKNTDTDKRNSHVCRYINKKSYWKQPS